MSLGTEYLPARNGGDAGLARASRASVGRDVLQVAAVALVYFAVARLSLRFLSRPEGIAAIWPGAGIFLSALLLTRGPVRPWLAGTLLVTDFVAERLAGTPSLVSFLYALTLTGDAVLSCWLLLRFVGERIDFSRVRDVVGWLVLSVVFSNATAALAAAGASLLLPGAHSFRLSWQSWVAADGVGNLLVTPCVIGWAARVGGAWTKRDWRRTGEEAAVLAASALLVLVLFGPLFRYPLFGLTMSYAVAPFFLWAALRYGVHSVAATVLAVGTAAVVCVAQGRIPPAASADGAVTIVWIIQAYLALMTVPLLILAAMVAERRRTRGVLAQCEAEFRGLFEHSAIGFALASADGRFLLVNDALCGIVGLARQELVRRTIEDISHPADRDAIRHRVGEIAAGRMAAQAVDERLLRADGAPVWVALTLSLVEHGAESAAGLVFTAQDIGRRRQAEEDAQASRESYRQLIENQTDLIVELDRDGRFVYVNPAYRAAIGRTAEDLLGTLFLSSVEVEDRESTARAMENLFQPPYCEGHEQRARTAAGLRWFSWRGHAVLDDSGNVTAVVAVGRDITERKEFELALKRSEEKFAVAFQASPSMMALARLDDGRYIDVNDAFLRLTGYAREEIVGRARDELGLWSDPEQLAAVLQVLRTSGRLFALEVSVRTKAGAVRTARISAVVVELGGVPAILTTGEDATELKRAEAEILEMNAHLERRVLERTEELAGANRALRVRTEELEAFNRAMIGREKRVIELKEEVNRLRAVLGQPPAYAPVWREGQLT
jgi:PAS domain S-box-containing protein